MDTVEFWKRIILWAIGALVVVGAGAAALLFFVLPHLAETPQQNTQTQNASSTPQQKSQSLDAVQVTSGASSTAQTPAQQSAKVKALNSVQVKPSSGSSGTQSSKSQINQLDAVQVQK